MSGGPQQANGAWVEGALSSLGVEGLRDLPGFLLVLVLVLIALDSTIASVPTLQRMLAPVNPGLAYLGHIAAAFVVTLLFYALGELWVPVFDSLYSTRGRLAHRDRRLWLLFPGGSDLAALRKQAADEPSVGAGPGIYARCMYKLRHDQENKADLERVINSRARARVCQTLILPLLVLGAIAIGVGLIELSSTQATADGYIPLTVGAVAELVGLGLIVPFVNERVAHMQALYETVGGPRRANSAESQPE